MIVLKHRDQKEQKIFLFAGRKHYAPVFFFLWGSLVPLFFA